MDGAIRPFRATAEWAGLRLVGAPWVLHPVGELEHSPFARSSQFCPSRQLEMIEFAHRRERTGCALFASRHRQAVDVCGASLVVCILQHDEVWSVGWTGEI